MNWTIFQTIYDLFATPLVSSVDAMIVATIAWMEPVLRYGIVVYVTGRLLWKAVSATAQPFAEVERLLLVSAIALWVVSSGYTSYARDLFLVALPNEITAAMTGAVGGQPITGVAFDRVWNQAFVAGLAVFRNLPWSSAAIGLAMVVVFYWFIALLAIAAAYLVWLSSFVLLALLVGIGPLFLPLALFPAFRSMALGWLSTVMANIVLQVLSVALLVIVMTAQTTILTSIAASVNSGGNEIAQIQMLMAGVVLFIAAGWVTTQLTGASQAITHGFAGGVSGLSRQIASWRSVMRPSPGSRGGSGSKPSSQSAPHPTRAVTPPGPSLSNP